MIFGKTLHKPSGSVKIGLQEVVERPHVQFLREKNVISNVLHDLTHQRQSTLDPRRWLDIHDSRFTRRH